MKYQFHRRPWDSQLTALRRLHKRKRQLFWFDPGEGKSKIAIDFIAAMLFYQKIRRALIIGPLTAIFGVWEEQIEIDAPHLIGQYHILRPDKKPDWKKPILLANYEYVSPKTRDDRVNKEVLESLLEWNADVLILDESHKIKNPYSRTAKACFRLSMAAEYLAALTGTPKGNKRVLDLWSPIHCLAPEVIPLSYGEFKDYYGVKSGFGGFERKKFRHLDELAESVSPYIMTQKAKIKHTPTHTNVRIDLSPKVKELYKMMEEEFLITIDKERIVTATIVLSQAIKLSQIAGGFVRTNDGEDVLVHRFKLDALQDLLEDLAESTDRVVIFARFTWEIEQIRKMLTSLKQPWPTYEISGRAKPEEKKLAKELFNSAGGALVCQIASGSASLNLQSSNYAIFYSIDGSYINYDQALMRLRPQHQERTCHYYHLRVRGTIDSHLYSIINQNRDANQEFRALLEGIRNDHKRATR